MATRSALSELSLTAIRSMKSTRVATRYFSDGKGRVLSEEERAAENVYIQAWPLISPFPITLPLSYCYYKMERERLEKLKPKQEKEKQGADKLHGFPVMSSVPNIILLMFHVQFRISDCQIKLKGARMPEADSLHELMTILMCHKHSHVLRCSSASVVKNFPSRVVLIGATKSERISGSLAKTILTALTKASKNRERETGLREFMAMVDKLQAQKSNAEHSRKIFCFFSPKKSSTFLHGTARQTASLEMDSRAIFRADSVPEDLIEKGLLISHLHFIADEAHLKASVDSEKELSRTRMDARRVDCANRVLKYRKGNTLPC
ncbi:hypothetical protein DKX38_016633 [Salix brachista]|uniref:Uncharacterized protein n=1 Tax=Salix brachista TaxID=2182728 RepID=A0A5N5L911_9ROSI|nr:hypothetical protein DKX38_016633 [Salix brachista]